MEYPNTQENHTKSQPLGSELLSPQNAAEATHGPKKTRKINRIGQSPIREPKIPTLSPQRLGRKRPIKPSQAPLDTKNPDQRLRPTQTRPKNHYQNPQLPYTSSPLNCTITRLGLKLIPHCPMRSHSYQESAEPYSAPWGTHEEVPPPSGRNPSRHCV